MKRTPMIALLGAISGVFSAQAADLAPGLWEITMTTKVPGEAGWTPQPFSLTQCLSAGDARDPSKLVGSVSTQGASGCVFTEKTYSGGALRFAMSCGGSFGLQTRGNVTFGAQSFDGTITATANVGGKSTEFQNQVSGRRVGAC